MRQSEYDMKVRNFEKFLFSCGEPALASLCLALWTVTIPAGIIRDGLMTALGALIDMASQGGRAAASNCPQHAQLLEVQPRALVHEAVALLVE
jgi:hypothetical protein